MVSASKSLMRQTDASESVRAFEERRKCWATSLISASGIANMRFIEAIVKRKIAYMIGGAHFREARMNSLAQAELEWINRTKRLLKAELKRADIGYEELARRLTEMGLPETTSSVTNKLSRGSFQATFLLATLKAIGKQNLNLEEV
jgi:hypothetical protein